MEFAVEDISGLPAHPLIVHGAVVLLPLAALGTVVVAALPKLRNVLAPYVLILCAVAVMTVALANQSGESLAERIDADDEVEERVDRHSERGEAVLPWAFALLVAASAAALDEPARRRIPRLGAGATTAVLVVAGLTASTGSVVSVVRAGHSGSEAVWIDNDHLEDDDDEDDDDEDDDDD